MTGFVAFAAGLFLGAEFLLGGVVCGGGEVVEGLARVEGDILMGTGATAAAGLTMS
jgi:hypothetical protein